MIAASDKVVGAILVLIAVAVFVAILLFAVLDWACPTVIAVYGYTDPFEYYDESINQLGLK